MGSFAGKNIVVVGLGKSGVAAVRFLSSRGASVVASDAKSEVLLADVISKLSGTAVTYSLGRNDAALFASADAVVVSPGVPDDLPGLAEARAKGVPVVGEMELAVREIKKPIIAITGTNGKTTTTSLIGHLLTAAGIKNVVAGNIGTPILDVIGEANTSDVVVLEVSSFQIDTSPSLSPWISILLNITPDHLDRHRTVEAYAASKGAMFERTPSDGFGIYNAADDLVFQSVASSPCRLVPFDATGRLFSSSKGQAPRAWYGDGDMWIEVSSSQNRYRLDKVNLKGLHNRENMLAALCACELAGADASDLRAGLSSFTGLPHRMEFVCEHLGVKYYDDSKGTNIGATIRALEECAEPVVLIAGGLSKGVDLSPLKPLIKERVKELVLIGESATLMEREFAGLTSISRASSMDDAVKKCFAVAAPGDVVLLSPACASFDMFRDYAHRGEMFVAAVQREIGSRSKS